MKLNDIEKHWKDWAEKYGEDIRATDKSKTKKAMNKTLNNIINQFLRFRAFFDSSLISLNKFTLEK